MKPVVDPVSTLRDDALAHTRDRQWASADEVWRRILDHDATNWEALYRLCEASFCLGNINDTIALGERAQALQPGDLRPLLFLGRGYLRARNFKAAQKIWARLTDANPAFYEAWFRLAQSQSETGQRVAAIEAIDRALGLEPLNPAAYPVIGRVVRLLPPTEAEGAMARWLGVVEAEKIGAGMALLEHIPQPEVPVRQRGAELRAAFARNPKPKSAPKMPASNTWEGRLANARALHALGDWDQARRAWSELTKMKGDNFEARFRLAQSLARLGDSKKALQHFERAYKAQPRHIRNLTEYAKCLVAEGRYKEALRLWRGAIKHASSDVDLRIGYTSLLAEMGKVEEARKAAAETFDLIAEPNRNALLLVRILSDLRSAGQIVTGLSRICRRDGKVPLERDQLELIAVRDRTRFGRSALRSAGLAAIRQ
jgi:tetratricopeptide (TPR) repeat protein